MEKQPNIDKREETFTDKVEGAVNFVESLPRHGGGYIGLEGFDPEVRKVITDLKAGETLRQLRTLENAGMEIGSGLKAKAAVLVALASYYEVTYDDRWHPRTKYEDPEYYEEVQRRFEVLSEAIFRLADIRLG